MVACRPVKYRKLHVEIMNILRSYCEDMIPKNIDETRSSKAALMGMLVSLCTKLEQRMVKSDIFCTEISFYADY